MRTDRGKVREQNEDVCYLDRENGLIMVADGLGGHAGGALASRLAVDSIAEIVQARLGKVSKCRPVEMVIQIAFAYAAEHLRHARHANYRVKDMGTTIVLVLCQEDRLWVAHLGDSRAYLFQHQTLTRLTQDHSIVEGLIQAGHLSSDDSKTHPLRHVVTRSLGQTDDPTPTIRTVTWGSGDQILLCSDGLTEMLSDDEIATMLHGTNGSEQDRCNRLLDAANLRGGFDNITIAIARHL